MISFTHSPSRTLAVATMLGSLVLAFPLLANAGDFGASASAPIILAQASAAPATTQPASLNAGPDHAVEAHIKELHNRLHITAAQQTQWDNLVTVMRSNATTMVDLQKARGKDASSMTAVDAIKSYQMVIRAHEKGMDKFVPAFEALYDTMSDSQKKTADSMFRGNVRTASAKAGK
ncbi:MAG: Spy/CpxP family protein refolding chaperone [Candidatus Binataceae bacterium]